MPFTEKSVFELHSFLILRIQCRDYLVKNYVIIIIFHNLCSLFGLKLGVHTNIYLVKLDIDYLYHKKQVLTNSPLRQSFSLKIDIRWTKVSTECIRWDWRVLFAIGHSLWCRQRHIYKLHCESTNQKRIVSIDAPTFFCSDKLIPRPTRRDVSLFL